MCDHNKLYVPMMVYLQYCGRVEAKKLCKFTIKMEKTK